jgi:hypothetical protein
LSFLPGESPDAADQVGLPRAVQGGAETTYPEYRASCAVDVGKRGARAPPHSRRRHALAQERFIDVNRSIKDVARTDPVTVHIAGDMQLTGGGAAVAAWRRGFFGRHRRGVGDACRSDSRF